MLLRRLALAAPRVAASLRATAFRAPAQRFVSRSPACFDSRNRLLEALREEIDDEKTNGTPPVFQDNIEGFTVHRTTGSPVAKFTRSSDKESVTVTLNLNDCVMVDQESDEDEDENVPAFPQPTVKIDVANKDNVVLTCEATLNAGAIQLTRVGIHDGSVKTTDEAHDKVYFTDAELLDGAFYEAITSYLRDAGISENFVTELEQFTTDLEYSEYVNWLGRFENFLSK